MVQPEGHPGHTDRHEGWDVDCEDVVGELKIFCQTEKLKIFDVDVLIFASMDKAGPSDVLNSLTQSKIYEPIKKV